MIGSSIGQYQVLEKLGEGGMGVVYKARDVKLNRFVAVKFLPPELVADPGRKARFIQEARAASALNHPNIVTIHDILSHDSGECLVMEYVEGKPLSQLITDKDLRLAANLKIAAQVADAVAAAHAAGIVHRDLKPSNIMVTGCGLAKVLDFGLAKLVSGPHAPAGATMTMPRTDPGQVVGTPGYMSPEQIRGQEVDRRSDIFSFGLILYEMLSGAQAFQGETSADVTSAILKEQPPDLPDSVPAALRQIVGVCLEKRPADRFESAKDIGHALRALMAGTSITGAMPKAEEEATGGRRRRLVLPLALATTTVAAVVFAVLYFLPGPEQLDLSAYKYTPFATESEREMSGVWSPDGKSIAYLKQVGRLFQLFTRALSASMPTRLTSEPAGVVGVPFWSPQSDRIYYVSDNKLWSIGVAGGEAQVVISDVDFAAALSPDGKTLVFWRVTTRDGKLSSSLWVSSPPGSPPRKYGPSPFEHDGQSWPIYIRFAPNGSKICLSEMASKTVWILDWPDGLGAKVRRPFPEGTIRMPQVSDWLPDSRHIVMATMGAGNLWLGDTRTGKRLPLTRSESQGQTSPSVSPDGRSIVFMSSNPDMDVVEVPLNGWPPRPYLANSRQEFSPSLSSAGDRMAYITFKTGRGEIWLRSAAGDWDRPVVTPSDFPDDPNSQFFTVALSPDGSRLAYARGAKARIWISPSSGGKPMASIDGYNPSWSPDGSSLACVGAGAGIAVVKIGSSEASNLAAGPGATTAPIWSPDGRWIAFGSSGQGPELTLISPDGRTTRKIPCPVRPWFDDFVMVWARDSSKIYMASSQTEPAQLFSVDIKTGKAVKIGDLGKDVQFRGPFNFHMSAALSPDGKSFLTTSRLDRHDLWILEGFPQPGARRR